MLKTFALFVCGHYLIATGNSVTFQMRGTSGFLVWLCSLGLMAKLRILLFPLQH